MTKDSPTPLGGGRASPKKPGSPGPATAVLEEQRRELEKLRAELEAERARGRSERRRFATQARQLRESAEQERQQLADHLRSKWEARRLRELRQLQDEVQREREAEIRQLLRWKEAELRQLQQLLHQERDGVVRQARELQRQLAQELVNRGYCGRSGASEDPAAQCRCRLQEVLALLRWQTDGEQAARIRHLQAALDLERQLFLKYILEHFRWQPPFPGPADLQITHSSEEPPLEAQSNTRGSPKPARRLGSLESLNSGVRVCSPNDLLPTRASSLESLATALSCSLNKTLSCSQASESEVRASSTSASIPDTSSPQPPLQVPSIHRNPVDLQEESSENKPCEALTPSPPGLDYHDLVRQNSELAEALQVLVRRCCGLREENLQLRRSGFSDEADEKVKWLKVKHAELTDLAQRLEDRARKLQETNLRAVSAPVPGESLGGLDLGQGFAHQRVQDLSEQADVLQAKDLQIEALRRKCHLLQARIAADLGSYSHPGEGATCTQLCNINDLDRLQRESQREVLRLQRQLTLQQRKAGSQAEAGSLSAPSEKARHQVQALERELGAQRRECEELSAQAAAAERRYEEAEAQLQAALHKGARLSEENARLQALASSVKKVADENSSVSLQQSRVRQRQEPEATGLPEEQLLQQAGCAQDRQEQLRHYQNNAPSDLRAFGTETQGLQCQPGHPSETPETTQASEPQARGSRRPKLKPKSEEHSLSLPITDVQPPASLSQQENPVTPGEPAGAPQVSDRNPTSQPLDSRPQAKKNSSQSNSSSVESLWATVPSCLSLDMDTASEMDDLEPDSVSTSPEMRSSEAPTTHKLRVFLARTDYNPREGPNEHCRGALPLTAGDYVYVCGDVDEDGFYEGELVNGQRGLVPSNLVEPISGSPILNHLFPTSPDAGPATAPPTEQSKALKGSFLGEEVQGSLERGLCQAGRADSKTDTAVERLKTKTEACWQGLKPSTEEQNFSRPLLEAKGVFCLGPMQLRLQNVTATSATITWASGSNRYPHMVYLEDEEHTLTPSGVTCYTLQGLSPGTRYRVRVGVQLPQDPLQVLWETMSPTITFDTPLAGPPDPPLDVLVEHHASPGFLVVSWLPVTIDSAGSSNGVQVTGYAVYVDGFKVTEVADATAGNTLLEFSQLRVPLACQKVSVRTTSLYGESLDSVPAQIPEDCFSRYLEAPPFSYTDGDPSACRVAFPVCQQKAVRASPSAKSSSHAPGSCGEPPATFLEAAPEERSRKHLPVPSLSSDRANNLLQEPTEAWKGYEKDLSFQKTPQNHRPPLLFGQPGLEEVHSPHMGISGSPAPEFVHLSPETGPVKVPCWEKPGLEKALLQEQYAQMLPPHRQGATQCHTADFHHILEEESLCLDSQYTEKPEQRKNKSQSGQRQGTPGSKRECQFLEPTSVLCPAPTSKVTKMSSGTPEELETEADSSVRVFVALFDHSPPVMPVNSEALEEELAFQKGQLLRVWGSRDAHGFYHGECNGQVGKIPGHLIVEAEVGTEQTDGSWHLLAKGHLHSEAQREEDLNGLTNSQGSFMPQENSRTPTLWTPKTMMAALDYNPRDGRAGGPKGKLVLRAGDVVTVYGPVDDKGFYHGEYGGHRGLVPAQLLDDLSVHGE